MTGPNPILAEFATLWAGSPDMQREAECLLAYVAPYNPRVDACTRSEVELARKVLARLANFAPGAVPTLSS